MGEIFIRLGEYHHADIAFTTAVYHFPNSARWWSRLGYAREMAEDWKYSAEAYDKALQLNSSYTEAVRGLGRVKAKLGAG
jgi:tetratricopeptide (TPR) repeat protein